MKATFEEEDMEEAIVKQSTPETLDVFGSGFERAHKIANALAYSEIVPTLYRGQENIPNCLIALDIANRTRVGVLAVMQNMYIVHGRPAFETKFIAAAVNACGRYSPLRTKCNGLSGDEYGYYAYATEITTGEKLIGTTINWKMVKDEGWNKNKKRRDGGVELSKWNTMPEQMFKYRAMAFWQREFDPGLTMGVLTVDEAEDIVVDIEKVEPAPKTLDVVIESNKRRAETSEKKASTEPTEPNQAQRDIAEAKSQASAMDTETLRVEVIDKASALWGDDAMLRLGQLMRQDGTSIYDAGFDALQAVSAKLDSMVGGGA